MTAAGSLRFDARAKNYRSEKWSSFQIGIQELPIEDSRRPENCDECDVEWNLEEIYRLLAMKMTEKEVFELW